MVRGEMEPVASAPRTYVFAVGDDANLPLGRMLARNNGVFESVRSTEPVEFKLNAFLSKIGQKPVDNLQLAISPADELRSGLSAGKKAFFPARCRPGWVNIRQPGGRRRSRRATPARQ